MEAAQPIYLDVVLVEARGIELDSSAQSKLAACKKRLKRPYCKISVGNNSIDTAPIKNARDPVWNDDATFVLMDEWQELQVALLEKNTGISKGDTYHAQVTVKISELAFDVQHDLWLDWAPPPSCEISQQKTFVTGRVHLKLWKSFELYSGILAHYGRPLRDVPIRMDAGDIVLVSMRGISLSHTVKVTTRSKWDHVGMVVKLRDKTALRLFEATMEGVETYFLNGSLQAYRSHAVVGIRRLQVERTPELLERLYEFVEEVSGRPYKSDWVQLIRAAYGSNEEEDLSSLFCSQLIAAAYQRMNLLPHGDLGDKVRLGKVRKIGELSNPKDVELRSGVEVPANLMLSVPMSERISNVLFAETATKKDAKMKQYTVYIIHVVTAGGTTWMLFKRFSEFYELDKQLRVYFKGLPKFPAKATIPKLNQTVVQQRRAMLQHYTRELLNEPTIECSLVVDFLTQGRRGVKSLVVARPSASSEQHQEQSSDGTKKRRAKKKASKKKAKSHDGSGKVASKSPSSSSSASSSSKKKQRTAQAADSKRRDSWVSVSVSKARPRSASLLLDRSLGTAPSRSSLTSSAVVESSPPSGRSSAIVSNSSPSMPSSPPTAQMGSRVAPNGALQRTCSLTPRRSPLAARVSLLAAPPPPSPPPATRTPAPPAAVANMASSTARPTAPAKVQLAETTLQAPPTTAATTANEASAKRSAAADGSEASYLAQKPTARSSRFAERRSLARFSVYAANYSSVFATNQEALNEKGSRASLVQCWNLASVFDASNAPTGATAATPTSSMQSASTNGGSFSTTSTAVPTALPTATTSATPTTVSTVAAATAAVATATAAAATTSTTAAAASSPTTVMRSPTRQLTRAPSPASSPRIRPAFPKPTLPFTKAVSQPTSTVAASANVSRSSPSPAPSATVDMAPSAEMQQAQAEAPQRQRRRTIEEEQEEEEEEKAQVAERCEALLERLAATELDVALELGFTREAERYIEHEAEVDDAQPLVLESSVLRLHTTKPRDGSDDDASDDDASGDDADEEEDGEEEEDDDDDDEYEQEDEEEEYDEECYLDEDDGDRAAAATHRSEHDEEYDGYGDQYDDAYRAYDDTEAELDSESDTTSEASVHQDESEATVVTAVPCTNTAAASSAAAASNVAATGASGINIGTSVGTARAAAVVPVALSSSAPNISNSGRALPPRPTCHALSYGIVRRPVAQLHSPSRASPILPIVSRLGSLDHVVVNDDDDDDE